MIDLNVFERCEKCGRMFRRDSKHWYISDHTYDATNENMEAFLENGN